MNLLMTPPCCGSLWGRDHRCARKHPDHRERLREHPRQATPARSVLSRTGGPHRGGTHDRAWAAHALACGDGRSDSGPMPADDWAGLFASAFQGSRNAMLLTDARRVVVDANPAFVTLIGRPRDGFMGRPVWELVVDGPVLSEPEWRAALAAGRFDGEVELHGAAGDVAVQWAATAETVTGGRRVLFVMLSASRSGDRFRREAPGSG